MRIFWSAFLLGAACLAQGPRTGLVVSTDWLAAHLEDPEVVVLHVTRDSAAYLAGHIPGAHLLLWNEFTVTRDGLPVELPPVAELVACFEKLGVSDRSHVVLYGDNLGLAAARAWFTLDYLGHGSHASLLDGGFEKWRTEGRPVSSAERIPKRGRLTPKPRPEIVAHFNDVRALIGKSNSRVLLLDARPPEEYLGRKAFGNPPRAGHIPGAVSLYWMNALMGPQNPVLKPVAELRRLCQQAGARPQRKLIAYCGAGVQAAYVYFLARYLGYDAALYDGSLAEWGRVPEAPLVTGSQD